MGLQWDLFEGIPTVYVTPHHIKGWRYFSTYYNGATFKNLIFQKLNAAGMHEKQGDWDWHHVVEGNHLSPLYTAGEYDNLYKKVWPTVLLHSAEEHKILNSLFRAKGTLNGLTTAASLPLKGPMRTSYINTLKQRYLDIYLGDNVLRLVAQNVINQLV